jgi:hypothetical protein
LKLYEATFAVIDALDRHQIQYVLVGGQAAIYYGIGRSTYDADLAVVLGRANLASIIAELGPDLRLDPQRRFEIFTNKECYEIDVVGTVFKIELFVHANDPFDEQVFNRRKRVPLHGHEVMMATPEDVIINKVRWQRAKDIADLEDLLPMQAATLDWPYVEHWCNAHGTRPVLDELRRKLGI